MMKIFSLFSGIGGFEKGAEYAESTESGRFKREKLERRQSIQYERDSTNPSVSEGECKRRFFTCVGCSEINPWASAIYRYHYPNVRNYGDARGIIPEELPNFDVLTFGWPCQDNSIAGKRRGQVEGSRSSLLSEAIRIMWIKKPSYFIAENVPGLFSVNEGYDFYKTIRIFAETGYDCQWQVLDTGWFLPQHRERIYFVGHLRGKPRPKIFPIGEISEKNLELQGFKVGAITARRGEANSDGDYIVESARETQKIIHTSFPGKAREYTEYSPSITTPSRGDHTPYVAVLTPDREKKRQNGRRSKNPNEPMFTLTSRDVHGIMSGLRIRKLTPVECERLQGFPDQWTQYGLFGDSTVKEVSDSQRYGCLGNAVSVPVAREVFGRLLECLK